MRQSSKHKIQSLLLHQNLFITLFWDPKQKQS